MKADVRGWARERQQLNPKQPVRYPQLGRIGEPRLPMLFAAFSACAQTGFAAFLAAEV